jgi:uncharacterized protein (DUF488 family)
MPGRAVSVVGAPTYNRQMIQHPTIWTVGHSNHDFERFADLVDRHRIAFLLDVRSYPYSRFAPHFNREQLQATIGTRGISYVFLGRALGGRPQREEHFDADGHALYSEMAQEPAFIAAIDRVLEGAGKHRVALLCSCGQPQECHRRLLIGKVLCDNGAELRHILPDATVLTERSVSTGEIVPESLFGHDEQSWRSTRSVSHRRRLSASSAG